MFQFLKQQFVYLNSKNSSTTNNINRKFFINEINVDLEFVDLQKNIDDAFFEYKTMQKIVHDAFAIFYTKNTRNNYQK